MFVSQLYEDKSLALRARDLSFTNDLQTVNYYTIITQQFTARADLFLKSRLFEFLGTRVFFSNYQYFVL